MKKIGLGIVGFVAFAVIYYLFLDSSRLTAQLKIMIDQELSALQSEGFVIQDRKIDDKKEHFIVVFDDPNKIESYFKKQHINIAAQDINLLQGMQIGVDLEYLKDSHSSLSFDLYPVALSTNIETEALSANDKKALTKTRELFKNKTFLLHMDLDRMFDGFKGYVKDINETVEDQTQKINFVLKSFHFKGTLDDNMITKIDHTLKTFIIDTKDSEKLYIEDIKGSYQLNGPTIYDASYHYDIKKIFLDNLTANQTIKIDQLSIITNTFIKNELAASTVKSSIKTFDIKHHDAHQIFSTLHLDLKVDNFDITSFKQLQNDDNLSKQEVDVIVQNILSKGIILDIFEFSVDKIESDHQKADGFDMNAKFEVDKSVKLSSLRHDPNAALSALNATVNMNFSDTLFTLISQKPEALMAMMLFQPKEEQGKKHYKIELQNGNLNINGVRMR